ncbi:hypothetical protein [Selenomonas sp. ND2010]|uniref:hypothetical protein n=1 Tax=Selenomonas sp. ND2010 TaxID=1410618 RepID=UPI00051B8217|nr:hypothetical protein [Selenomonas sp. ND2010]
MEKYFLSLSRKHIKKRIGSREAIYELTEDLYFDDCDWKWIKGYSPQDFAIYMQICEGRPTGYYKLMIPGEKKKFYCRINGGGGL